MFTLKPFAVEAPLHETSNVGVGNDGFGVGEGLGVGLAVGVGVGVVITGPVTDILIITFAWLSSTAN